MVMMVMTVVMTMMIVMRINRIMTTMIVVMMAIMLMMVMVIVILQLRYDKFRKAYNSGFQPSFRCGSVESGSMSRVEIWHCCRSIDADAFSEKTDFLSRNCIMCADV